MHGFIYAQTEFHAKLEEIVNNHMKSQNLDITLKVDFENPESSSGDPNHVANALEQSILKKEKGFDLYVTDTVYTGRFAQHFEDLNKYVDKKVIDLYKDGTATSTCYVDTKLVGLPLTVDYGGLYANMDLLNKYNQTVPKTWDELIQTTNYIYDRESPTDPELHKYLAHFPEYENGLVSLLEFIHSFRDSPNDKFPEYTSDNAAAALEEMRKIKETASTPDDFATNEMLMMGALFTKKFIFARFWYIGERPADNNFSFNQLPGKKEGISASCVGGANTSMNRYISEEKKIAAAKVIDFINSYEQQKQNIIQNDLRSAIHSTYSDPEVCQKIDCPKFSSMQGIVRPSSSSVNYEQYSEKFRELARKFIFRESNESAKEILEEIDDIRKIHYVEVNSIPSIVIISVVLLTIILIFCCYIYLSIKRFRKQFIFLSFNYWCIFLFGILMVLSYCLTGLHKLNNYNCLIRPFLLSIGFSLIYIPLFLKMISIFPSKNSFTKFVKDHYSLVFILFLIVDLALNITWYIIDPLIVNKFMVTAGKNFQYCSSSSTLGSVMQYIMYAYKLCILMIMCVLVFAEWNLAAFKQDIRSITSTLYINILLIGMFIIVERINIQNRYLFFGLRAALVYCFCLSTLVIIFGSKYYNISLQKENPYPDVSSFKSSSGSLNSSQYYNSNFNRSQQFSQNQYSHVNNKSGLLSYHYQTGNPSVSISGRPTLFSSTFNNSYNGNVFSNSSNSMNSKNDTQSSNSFTNSKYSNSKNYSNNNYSNNNYSNNGHSNNYSNNNYSNNNYGNYY
ncbi:periplasmic binding protein-like II [Neocallimastix sp. 'constans']